MRRGVRDWVVKMEAEAVLTVEEDALEEEVRARAIRYMKNNTYGNVRIIELAPVPSQKN